MKTKKVSLAVLALATTVVVSACGNNNTNNSSSSAPAASGSAAVDKVKVSVTSWRAGDSEVELYKKIQEELNKVAPEIELEYKAVKATEYNTSLSVALKTDSAADIIHLRPYAGTTALADANYLEPIDGLEGLSVFTADQLAAAQGSDGKQYGVPYMLSATQILYNKDIFEKNGLTVPKTWDEMIKVADKLKENKVTPFAFGSKEGWVLSLMHGAIAPQFYGADFNEKFLKGEAKLNSPEFIKSIEAMNSLKPYFPNNFEGLGMEDIRTMFATGQTGMVIDGHFEIASIQALNPDIKIGMFPVPPVDANGKASISTWVDGSFGINKNSKNKEAAKKVLQFMTTETYGSLILNSTKSPSPIPGVSTDDELVNEIAQYSATNAVPYFAVTYLNSGSPTTKSALENALQGMYLNALTPEGVAEEVQKSLDTWFKPVSK
ncbi:ABC transporter substrate-binding protein [Cohnella sp. WQ 127256]|uniref:ABC transporter substrate-binding protein n=1 Tax=Cohnella sp. WQ 127256 TaxID=2938790 RepID=UPI002117BBB3|nr:extracellular solute-binding protein [Cohnella sp. WQ 127256]